MGWEEEWLRELRGIKEGMRGIEKGMRGIERELRLLRERGWRARGGEEKEDDRLESEREEETSVEEIADAERENEEMKRMNEGAERKKKRDGREKEAGGSEKKGEESVVASDKKDGKRMEEDTERSVIEWGKEGGERKGGAWTEVAIEGRREERRRGDKTVRGRGTGGGKEVWRGKGGGLEGESRRRERQEVRERDEEEERKGGMEVRGGREEGSRGEVYGKKSDRVEKEGEGEGSWWRGVDEEEGEGVKGIWKKVKERMVEVKRREEERVKEREARERRDEQVRRERKRRNLVWRGIEGDNFEERCLCLRVLLEEMLEKKVELRGVEERLGDDGKSILLVVLEKEEDRDEVLERRGEVGRRWRMSVDEDLTREERKMKWRIKERARLERNRGKSVEYDSRRLWIEGKEWKWDEEAESWRECKEC
ncbi:unnamed protein product [Lasius platythorax]|uniref:Uncharacterized protein n=1 Tax=Lasius platythorax TaxID=488582 RepID=A0AAV2MY19_9HYME